MMPIYFIEAGDRAAIKIGRSHSEKTANGRLEALRLGNHLPLKMIRMIPGDFWQENWIHLYFSAYKLQGEWFSFAPEMLTIIPPPSPIPPRVFVPAHEWLKRIQNKKRKAAARKRAARKARKDQTTQPAP